MRIPCPLCGPRDRREFTYYGSDDYLRRPGPEAPMADWDDHLHLRDNPAGPTRDLWYHDMGCSAWVELTRDTVSHAILSARLVGQAADASGGSISAKKKPRATKGGASA